MTVIRRPLAPGQFWAQHNFQSNAVMDEQLEIDIPSGRAVKVKTKPDIDAWETRDSKRGIYHWKSLNPTLKYRQSTTDPWHETADVQLSSFGSWEEVGRWYARLEENRRIPTTEVRAKADELTKGLHSDLEKAEALYEFVAKKIKYLSLMSLGVGGYVPSSANEVLRKGNGDCKDKVTLLAALLEAKGMYASSVLINPNRELEPEVPSPWPFTHVITMLPLGDEKIWMDPSSALLPFRTLSPQLRKKQGLVMPPGGAPYFEETPQDAPVSKSWLEKLDGRVGQNGVLNNAQGFQVLLGNGDGTFEAPVDTNLVTPLTFAVGDFDGDGKTDVVVTTTANAQVQISLYLSNGDGTFRLGQQYAQVYGGVNVADVNKDGKEDLVIIGFAQPLLVMLGNGDGTFQKAISGPTAFYSGEAVIRDFNGDGKPDIVVGTYDGIAFLKGNGNGTFEAPVYSNPTLQFCCQASAGDFNGDGRLDVVSNLYNTVLVIPGNGDGTFQSPTAYSQNGQLYSGNIVVGDFNYDGVSDVGLVINDQTTGATEASLYLSEPAVHLFPSSVNFGSEKVEIPVFRLRST